VVEVRSVQLASGEWLTEQQAIERLALLAEAWSATDCEEVCAHEVGDALALLLFVLKLAP
jgi:hypothetical protein